MFQKYYKSQAKYYSVELKRFNEKNLKKLDDFNDAVKKYKKLKAIYDKIAYYIKKLPNGYIGSVDNLYSQIERKCLNLIKMAPFNGTINKTNFKIN